MPQIEYPKFLYKDKGEQSLLVTNADAEAAALAAGWEAAKTVYHDVTPDADAPKSAEHLEYPKMLHGADGAQFVVADADGEAAALAAGWSLTLVVDAPAVDETAPEADAPVADAPKAKRGRKAKPDAGQ